MSRFFILYLLLLAYQGASPVWAQQSRVDTIVHWLRTCKTAGRLDTLLYQKTLAYISDTKVTDRQFNQIERAASHLDQGTDQDLSYFIKCYLLEAIILTNKNKAIAYAKSTIGKLDISPTPHATPLKYDMLVTLRFPYRSSDQLKEGIRYYNQLVNRYKARSDSTSLSACHYVLSGFYRVAGLMDQAIYQIKKSMSYLDTLDQANQAFMGHYTNKDTWIDRTGNLGSYLVEQGDYRQAIHYLSISFAERHQKKC